MFKNYKVVVNTAAGRRRYMQYLIPYVVACEIVDRYDLWVNTMNCQDIEFFKQLAAKYPKINLVWQPDGVINGNLSINAFYLDCVEDNTIYFKLDDDIIWMEDDLIEKMVKFRIDNPQYFLVTPLVINNSLSTYLLQVSNKIHISKYCNSYANHDILWKSGEFCLELHKWFFDNYLSKLKVKDLHIGTYPMGMTRFSINAILWFGKDMKKFGGTVPGDDEDYLSCIYPTQNGLINCWNGDVVASHFAFFTQRECLDKGNVLEKYGDFLEKEWETSPIFGSIFNDVKQAMKYVEDHKGELPPPPYRSISRPKNHHYFKQLCRFITPYSIYKFLKERNIRRDFFIIE